MCFHMVSIGFHKFTKGFQTVFYMFSYVFHMLSQVVHCFQRFPMCFQMVPSVFTSVPGLFQSLPWVFICLPCVFIWFLWVFKCSIACHDYDYYSPISTLIITVLSSYQCLCPILTPCIYVDDHGGHCMRRRRDAMQGMRGLRADDWMLLRLLQGY